MSLFRKISFIVFLACACGLGALAYLHLKNSRKPATDALQMIPDSCAVYLSSADFFELNKKLKSQSLIADKLRLFKEAEIFCTILNRFDSLLASEPQLKEELQNNTIHFALYPASMDWLATFNISQLGEQEQVNETISKTLNAHTNANGYNEFSLRGNKKYFYVLQSGVVMISATEQLLKLAGDAKAKKLYRNSNFLRFKNTLEENKLLSVYVDQNLYQKSNASAKLRMPAISGNGFSAGSVDIQPSELKINGFMNPDSTSLVSAFFKQEAQQPDFIEDLPFTTNYFQAYGFSAFSDLFAGLAKKPGIDTDVFWRGVNDSAMYNVKAGFISNIGNCMVDFQSGSSKQKFVFVNINDTLLAREHLTHMSDSIVVAGNDSVFVLLSSDLKLFSPLSECLTRFAVIHRSNIYFGEKMEDVMQLVYNLKNNLLITENESFLSYTTQNFPERFNYISYSAPNLDRERRKAFFNLETNSKTDPFENFRHFSFSLTNIKKKLEFRWHLLNETEAVNKEQNFLWALQLDTTSSQTTFKVINHVTKENELFLQDDAAKLYRVNAKGTILWKKQIKEKISSPVYVVDVFKNNKYQMLFSSLSQLHLIDRNGNYLPGYPVDLPAESSCALSVFDYDQTRDYRLLIACKNNMIYNYQISGKKHDKFVPFRTENKVRLSVQYVKVGASDYLVALDEEGRIYTLSRRGEGRIGLKNRTTAGCNAFFIDATSNVNSTYLVYTDDKNSLINKISLADKKEIIKLNYDIENAGINFSDAGEHKTTNVIFTKLNAIIAYDLNGNLLLSRSFENDLTQTDFYDENGRAFYLSWSAIRGEVLFVDPLKQRTESFKASAMPLVADLFSDNKKYFVITSGNRLSCVLMN